MFQVEVSQRASLTDIMNDPWIKLGPTSNVKLVECTVLSTMQKQLSGSGDVNHSHSNGEPPSTSPPTRDGLTTTTTSKTSPMSISDPKIKDITQMKAEIG